jgi:hypothetical protein
MTGNLGVQGNGDQSGEYLTDLCGSDLRVLYLEVQEPNVEELNVVQTFVTTGHVIRSRSAFPSVATTGSATPSRPGVRGAPRT